MRQLDPHREGKRATSAKTRRPKRARATHSLQKRRWLRRLQPQWAGDQMSRRRRDEGEEKRDPGFEIPEFDEDEFIRKETISFRTTLILFLYSVITALITFAVWGLVVDSWFVSLLVAGATGYLLRFIYPALKVDISHFGKKEWTGTGFLYFFSWLAFFIFLTNPPLYDGVAPDLDIHITPDQQELGGMVNISLAVADNLAIDEKSLKVTVKDSGGTTLATEADFIQHSFTHVWSWQRAFTDGEAGTYTVDASVKDAGDGLLGAGVHTTKTTSTFRIGDVLTVRMSGTDAQGVGNLQTAGDRIEVLVPSEIDVYRVWLGFDNGPDVLLAKDKDTSGDDVLVYYATANFAGFGQGNNTFRVHVEEHDQYFLQAKYGIDRIDAPLVSTKEYTAVIEDGTLIGDHEEKGPSRRSAQPKQTPGFEAPLALAALVGVLALARPARRKA